MQIKLIIWWISTSHEQSYRHKANWLSKVLKLCTMRERPKMIWHEIYFWRYQDNFVITILYDFSVILTLNGLGWPHYLFSISLSLIPMQLCLSFFLSHQTPFNDEYWPCDFENKFFIFGPRQVITWRHWNVTFSFELWIMSSNWSIFKFCLAFWEVFSHVSNQDQIKSKFLLINWGFREGYY